MTYLSFLVTGISNFLYKLHYHAAEFHMKSNATTTAFWARRDNNRIDRLSTAFLLKEVKRVFYSTFKAQCDQ